MSKRQFVFFVLVFGVLLAGRLCIAGSGYLNDPDEFFYIWMHMHIGGFTHLSTWTLCVNEMQGQPPAIAARLLEYISLKPVAAIMGKQMLSANMLYFIGLYNIAVSLLLLYVFYRILLKLSFNTVLALTGTLLLGTLFNFNMYTRHILPYDQSLLFQLLAFNLLLRPDTKPKTILLAGLLSAIGLTNYLGCFMFIFINGGFILLSAYKTPAKAIKNALFFVAPFVALVLFYEAVMQYEGQSYIGFLRNYSQTIEGGGSPDEGLYFIFLYFYMVEKWWGVLLLGLLGAGSYLIFKKGEAVNVKLVLALGLTGYLCFGAYVFLFHKMVFEGRVLHIYYPFVIIGVLGVLKYQKLINRGLLVTVIVLFACINYGFVIKDFNNIGYPRDAIYKYHLFEEKGRTGFTYYNEMSPVLHYNKRAKYYIDSVGPAALPPGHYLLTNICFLPDFPDSLLQSYKPWRQTAGDSVVFMRMHFQSHPAYAFEYCSRYGRRFYIENQFKIRVIKSKNALQYAF